jgi:hypothetical protein
MLSFVMAGYSRSKKGVASLAYGPAISIPRAGATIVGIAGTSPATVQF